MSSLKERIAAEKAKATVFAASCEALFVIGETGLAEAMEFCRSKEIDPPQCSLTAQSLNADLMRMKARRMLSETKWWSRRLEQKAVMDFENEQRRVGLVTNCVSDELLAYYRKKQRQR